MDLEEFKQRLLSEPRADDPEMNEARRESVAHARAASQAEAFEDKLERALCVPVEDGLADRIVATCFGRQPPRGRPVWHWLSAAAVLALAVALGLLLPRPDSDPIAQAFVDHLHAPEPMALAASNPVDGDRVRAALAAVGATSSPSGQEVTFVAPCVIGGVRGVHLVMTDAAQRKTTLMFIPNRTVAEAESFTVDDMPARMFATGSGVVALFGHDGQNLEVTESVMFGQGSPVVANVRT